MEKQTKLKDLSELEKIKYLFNYKINEANYRQLVKDNEEFDEIPSITTEADEENNDNNNDPNKEKPLEIDPKEPTSVGMDAPTPDFDKGNDQNNNIDDNGNELPIEEPIEGENPELKVDEIQNDIIKHNIEAMKNIHTKLEDLNNIVLNLNSKIDNLDADVEEVREPTNVEKLMDKKNVSYPYYFNLNDFWEKNWFSEKRNNDENESQGMKKMPDGTYVADFDDLPKSQDIKKSFDTLI